MQNKLSLVVHKLFFQVHQFQRSYQRFEVLQDIRETQSTADIPVMMLTARGQVKDREKAEQVGANMFMTKPFSNAEVLEKINSLVT